jgi:hypothetical protein
MPGRWVTRARRFTHAAGEHLEEVELDVAQVALVVAHRGAAPFVLTTIWACVTNQ